MRFGRIADYYYCMYQKGNIALTVLVLVFIVGGIAAIWYFGGNEITDEVKNGYTSLIGENKNKDYAMKTADWQTYDNTSMPVILKYPGDWYNNGDSISQYPFNKDTLSTRTYNIIRAVEVKNAIYGGYTNQDLVDNLYATKIGGTWVRDYYNASKEGLVVIEKGKLDTGQRYIVYKIDSHDLGSGNALDNIRAVIQKGDAVIQLTLSNYDDTGIEFFKSMVASAKLR